MTQHRDDDTRTGRDSPAEGAAGPAPAAQDGNHEERAAAGEGPVDERAADTDPGRRAAVHAHVAAPGDDTIASRGQDCDENAEDDSEDVQEESDEGESEEGEDESEESDEDGDVEFAASEERAGPPDEGLGAEPPADADEPPSAAPAFSVEEWMIDAVEALTFTSTEPLTPARAREVLGAELAVMEGYEGRPEPSVADMQLVFRALLERWGDPTRPVGRGFRLVEIDGGMCFRTVAANARYIRRMQLGKPQRLSRASLETLAVIAYRQPVTKPQIEEVRGVDSSGAIKALLDKKLVRIIGKAEEIGRPLLYGTTKTFLEFFELSSLTDLPTLKELHELEHGVSEPVAQGDDRPAVIMDLFNATQVSAVSEETEKESHDALDALEQALGQAKDVAKRASSLVFGMEVEDADDGGGGAKEAGPSDDAPKPGASDKPGAPDEDPKA